MTVLTLSPTVGCILGARDSLIEKGEKVEVGRRNFDEYFEQVAELRDKVEGLDSDLFPLREPLVEELDLSVDVALGQLLDATRKRVTKVKDFGVSMTLRLRPTPTVDNEHGEIEPDDKHETFIRAVEESATRAMKTFEEYSALLDRASDLDRRRGELADAIEKLPPDVDRGVVEREIKGAGVVIRTSEKKLIEDTRSISHFLVGLVAVVDTGGTESRQQRCDEAIAFHEENKKKPAPKPTPRWRPPAGGRPPGGAPAGGPAPAPKPRPKPGGGDFEM